MEEQKPLRFNFRRLPPTIGDLRMPQFPSDSLPLLATSGCPSSPQTPSHYWRPQDPPVPLRLPPTIAIGDLRIPQFPADSLPLLATSGSSSSPQTPSHYWRPQDPSVPLRIPLTSFIHHSSFIIHPS